MSNGHPVEQTFKPIEWQQLEGVRTRRIIAFLIDYGLIVFLITLSVPIVAILGLATFGAGWLLYGILAPLVALSYVAWTISSPKQATWGMQLMNIKLARYDSERIDAMMAVVHAVLFWATGALFSPLLLAPLFLKDKRTLHDYALGTLVVRDI